MNSLENLPEISEHVLSGLKADSGLKHRILLSASSAPAAASLAADETCRFLCARFYPCRWIRFRSALLSFSSLQSGKMRYTGLAGGYGPRKGNRV